VSTRPLRFFTELPCYLLCPESCRFDRLRLRALDLGHCRTVAGARPRFLIRQQQTGVCSISHTVPVSALAFRALWAARCIFDTGKASTQGLSEHKTDILLFSCNTSSSLILTPPQSGDESSSTATNPSSSSFTYSTQPKVAGSNVSGSEYYSSTAPGYIQPTFNGSANMTQFDRRTLHM